MIQSRYADRSFSVTAHANTYGKERKDSSVRIAIEPLGEDAVVLNTNRYFWDEQRNIVSSEHLTVYYSLKQAAQLRDQLNEMNISPTIEEIPCTGGD